MANDDKIIKLSLEAEDLLSDEVIAAKNTLRKLGKEASDTEKKLKDIGVSQKNIDSYIQLGKSVDTLNTKYAKNKAELQALDKEIKNGTKSGIEAVKGYEKQKLELSQLRKEVNSQEASYRRVKKALQGLNVETKGAEFLQQKLAGEYKLTSESLKVLTDKKEKLIISTNAQAESEKKARLEREKSNLAGEAKAVELYKNEIFELSKAQKLGQISSDEFAQSRARLIKELKLEKAQLDELEKNQRILAATEAKSIARKNEQIAKSKELQAAFAKESAEKFKAWKEEDRINKENTVNAAHKEALAKNRIIDIKREKAELEKLYQAYERGAVTLKALESAEQKLANQYDLSEKEVKKLKLEMERLSDTRKKVISEMIESEAQSKKDATAKAIEQNATKKLVSTLLIYREELAKLNAAKAKGKISNEQFIAGEEKLRNQLRLTAAQAKKAANEISAAESKRAASARSTDILTHATRRLAQAYTVLIAAQSATRAVGASVKEYGELEAAITGIEKTTGDARDELNKLAEHLQHLSENVTPTATNELLKYGLVAGQLGKKGSADILTVVAAADALAQSTDLAGDEAAILLSRILEMTNEGTGGMNGLASSVVELGNNMALTEGELLHMTKEVVTGTASLNLGASAAAAFGATLKESGQQAERSRTAMFKLSQAISSAAINGGAELETLLKIMNSTGDGAEVTAESFKKSLGEVPEQVLLKLVEGFSAIKEGVVDASGNVVREGGNISAALKTIGIDGSEAAQVVEILADKHDRLAWSINLSAAAKADQTKHFQEAAKVQANQESQVARLVNQFTNLKSAIGESITDETKDTVDELSDAMERSKETVISLMDGMIDLGKFVGEAFSTVFNVFSNLGDAIETSGLTWSNWANGVKLAANTVGVAFSKVVLVLQEALLANQEFFGASEESLAATRESIKNTTELMETDLEDMAIAHKRILGESSSAYEDLIASVKGNEAALANLTREQRSAIQTIVNQTGYQQEQDKTYRSLTAAMTRAARAETIANEQKKLATQLDKERNEQLEKNAKIVSDAITQTVLYEGELESLNQKIQEQIIISLNSTKTTDERSIAEKNARDLIAEREVIEGKLKETIKLSTVAESERTKIIDEQVTSAQKLAVAQLEAAVSTKKFKDESKGLSIAQQEIALSAEKYEQSLDELKATLKDVTLGEIKRKETLLEIVKVEKQLKDVKEDSALLNKIETQTLSQLNAELEKNKQALMSLENQFSANAIKAGEYRERKKEIVEAMALLNAAIDGNTTVMQDNVAALIENAEATNEVAESKENAIESVEDLSDAIAKGIRKSQQATTATSVFLEAQNRLNSELDYSGETTEDLIEELSKLEKQYKILRPTVSQWWDQLKKMDNEALDRETNTIRQTLQVREYTEQVKNSHMTLGQLNRMARQADLSFDLLGDNQLEPLRQAIEDAKREFQDLSDTIDDELMSVQDRLDSLLGNEADIIKRKFEREMAELEALRAKAVESRDRDLIAKINEAIAKLKQAQKIELGELKASNLKDASNKTTSNSKSNGQNFTSSYNVTIQLPTGTTTSIATSSDGDAQALIEALASLGEININGG